MNKTVLKKIWALFLALACVMSAGCAGIYDKEYVVISDYEPSQQERASEEATIAVSNYAGLKKALRNLVSEGRTEGSFIFPVEYDGDLTNDMSSACWDVRTQDALCAYCVENISYEISRIVSYDEATVYITYSDSGIPFPEIKQLQYSLEIEDALKTALSAGQQKIAMLVNYSQYTESGLESYLDKIYRSDPAICPKEPSYSVDILSGINMQRLYEISIDYGMNEQELMEKQKALEDITVPDIQEEEELLRCISAVEYLAESCSYNPNADSSVYSALINHESDSNGISLAFVALCNRLGIKCTQVSGQYNRTEHYWNIVTIDEENYHIDISTLCGADIINASFKSDDSMWEAYRWDIEAYPSCNNTVMFSQLIPEPIEQPDTDTEP